MSNEETGESNLGGSSSMLVTNGMIRDPSAIELVEGPDEDLVEELSAYDQAMVSEEQDQEGTFLTGGNTRDFMELTEEQQFSENFMLNPAPVKDGEALLNYLRKFLHKFDSPYAFIGGEANSPDQSRFKTAEVKILVARLSSYESVSLSMTHSLMSQIYAELPYTFTDLAFMPKPNDYATLKENKFPVWFGTNTKLAPCKFDILSISHAVSMEQLNFVPLLHDSGIPIFKQQRMLREDIPIIIVGGANAGTTAPLSGEYVASDGTRYSHLIDAVIYGDGEEAAKQFVEVVREGKQKGWTKLEILAACHGRVDGFYEPDKYVHEYDGAGSIKSIYPISENYEFPVKRATVRNLDTVRTLEEKILPFTGDGASVDVAIAGSVGCIGSAGWGACSFCREGSEGPYRERSVGRVMEALDKATRNQGTKEVSFFSLNFNMYTDLFPLVEASVKKGYKIGLISQRIDMLAETPEQVHVQRWLKKSNFTLGIEGISNRIRAFLNKNVQEWEILKVCREMMLGGAGELKMFYILTNMETQVDVEEHAAFMEKVNALREKLGAKTRFRLSFTPLFPSAFTALQFSPCLAAIKFGEKNLNGVFEKARDLGWGRRLSVSGEEPLISNTINHGGRNITPLLLKSHFSDGFRFYGNVPKGTWARWKVRIDQEPNIDMDKMWGEKSFEYVFPWEDIHYSTSKEVMYRGYLKAVTFNGVPYCITTPTIKGECHVNECGACDPGKTGKPDQKIIKAIVGRKVAPPMSVKEIERIARSREKAYHLRVLAKVDEPIYRYVEKNYFLHVIPRALMRISDKFTDAFVGSIGHARIGSGANGMRDWVFGHNIYDFSLCEIMSEQELKDLIPLANKEFKEGTILDIRMDTHLTSLRNDVDFAVYTMLIPASEYSYKDLRDDVGKYFERKGMGRKNTIKVKKAFGKDIFKTVEVELSQQEIRQVDLDFRPDLRGCIVRMVVSQRYNVLAMLETITGRKSFRWKGIPVYCDGYISLSENTGEVDVFEALSGDVSYCTSCGGPLERDLFSGQRHSDVCLSCSLDSYPLDTGVFFTKLLTSVDEGNDGTEPGSGGLPLVEGVLS